MYLKCWVFNQFNYSGTIFLQCQKSGSYHRTIEGFSNNYSSKASTGRNLWSENLVQQDKWKAGYTEQQSDDCFSRCCKVDQSTASMAKDVGLKITTIKTDIRRMSGLVTDVTSLTDSVQELENKIEKVEKNTVKNIGDLLSK